MKNKPKRKKAVGYWILLSVVILAVAFMVTMYLLRDRIDSMSVCAKTALCLAVGVLYPALVLCGYISCMVSNIREKKKGRLVLNSVLAALTVVIIVYTVVFVPPFVEHEHEEQSAYDEYQALQEQKDYNTPEVRAARDAWYEAYEITRVDSHKSAFIRVSVSLLWCSYLFSRNSERDHDADGEVAPEDTPIR